MGLLPMWNLIRNPSVNPQLDLRFERMDCDENLHEAGLCGILPVDFMKIVCDNFLNASFRYLDYCLRRFYI